MASTSGQDAAAAFDPLRPRLVRIAYRMLGSVADAEDVVPGFVTIEHGDTLQTTALEIADGKIAAIYVMRNPDKLQHLRNEAIHRRRRRTAPPLGRAASNLRCLKKQD